MGIKLNAETLIRHVLEDEIPEISKEKKDFIVGRLTGRIKKPIVLRPTVGQGEPS